MSDNKCVQSQPAMACIVHKANTHAQRQIETHGRLRNTCLTWALLVGVCRKML